MRMVALVIVVGIVYLVYGQSGEKQSPDSRLSAAQHEASLVQPAPPSAAPSAPAGSLRAPMDRTRQVLEQVTKRNVE